MFLLIETRIEMRNLNELVEIFTDIQDKELMQRFFQEIFTPSEIQSFCNRWEIMKQLRSKTPQREIASSLKISLCKITRGSKILKDTNSAFNQVLTAFYNKQQSKLEEK